MTLQQPLLMSSPSHRLPRGRAAALHAFQKRALIAAAGAALFAMSEGFATLVLARALIGLGVAAALTAGLKAIVLWFPKERIAVANGYMVMIGALGAVTATAPADLLLTRIGWRG